MVRRSTRTRSAPTRFGYTDRFEPYARKTKRETTRTEGRRYVPATPLTLPTLKEKKTQLKVLSVDLSVERNQQEHKTSKYKVDNLVLRRGQPFHLNVKFDRDFKPSTDELVLELRMGSRANVTKGTRCVAPVVTSAPDHDDWGIKVESAKGANVTLKVFCSSEALIGYYNLYILTTSGGDEYEYESPKELVMLFNAWCKDDGVYMADEVKRQEYVMGEVSLYFYGSKYRIGSSPWNYGQFEKMSLDCALYLLQKSGMPDSSRKSPIQVSRVLSALVNAQDDDGVLVGRWDGEYDDGISPTTWTGSIAILSQYMKTRESVKYGQCWVFGSLLTGLCRSLGLPTRTITNFASAHDTDGNLTLDYHYDENSEPLDDYDEDSIWNFHVWNDCWMARPDLEEGYGGWQAVDATPQETSNGVYCMGPTSLRAIKQGHVYMQYDTKFAFAEVNAEKVYWKVFTKSRKAPEVIDIDSDDVGCKISTKAVGKFEREDITEQYKYKEGTELERIAVREASRHVRKAKRILKNLVRDVSFDVDMAEEFPIGKDIKFTITLVNKSQQTRNIFLGVTGNTVYYTGVKKAKVSSYNGTLPLKAKETRVIPVTVPASDYLPQLTDYAGVTFFIMASVKETKQPFSRQYDAVLDKPDLEVKTEGPIVRGKPFTAIVSLTNPLPYPLTDCSLLMEGSIIEGAKRVKAPHVPVNGKMAQRVQLTPKTAGSCDLIVSFSSPQLSGVKAHVTLNVKSA
ncbi:protein-glutamine gamma-glutamyltransferase K-like [Patiria miniata]|uniref:protein-glutamine gamma-glutamyltransferase n=1 Tax=Patiria miniata TaxID=46514 RepID=A0A913ZWH5_PATMI|nr:protein-glutamine gamma-glutamyltransferase K-like [Patiria miniata]XP_038055656.1 protein-glutamine gamma-glutamyltransferase K-like [Patiria miniata]XP_038055657.1 protein-glutamine gamma-glutamyltransferase K-like [Patiria miniata]